MVDFLLKNGPPSIISSFKYDIYQFRSFDNYSHYSDGIDRGEASTPILISVREKSKTIVELLSNEELLEEERVKAKTIRERMAGVVGGSGGGYSAGGYGGSSNYGGSSYGNQSKYESYNSKNVGSMSSGSTGGYGNTGSGLGVYGDYGTTKSTLDKYKDPNGKKPANNASNPITANYSNAYGKDVKEEAPVETSKKPFEKVAKKLGKPGSKPAPKAE
jgi:hypothetical protein